VRRGAAILVLALCGAWLGACTDEGPPQQPAGPPPKAVVRVLAPDALTEAFGTLGDRFTATHPGRRVDFLFAASSTLLAEVERGRAAAVLATADPATMQAAVDDGLAIGRVPFASSALALVVAAGNPKGITGVSDLARGDVRIALCDEDVVCGSLGRDALVAAGVDRAPATTGPSARAVLLLVADGTADAGLVFTTTPPSPAVETVGDVTAGDAAAAVYEIGLLAGAVDKDGAQAWIDFVTGAEGQAILAQLGFGPP
jgi:molybdate transport system substrate-binding protein